MNMKQINIKWARTQVQLYFIIEGHIEYETNVALISRIKYLNIYTNNRPRHNHHGVYASNICTWTQTVHSQICGLVSLVPLV